MKIVSLTVFVSIISIVIPHPIVDTGMYWNPQELYRNVQHFKENLPKIPELWNKFTKSFTLWKIPNSIINHIPPSVRKMFTTYLHEEEMKNSTLAKERGQIDPFGRSLAKRIGKTFTYIGDKLGITSTSKGLDVDRSFKRSIASNFKHVRAIYPGTLWCGDGDRAKSSRELGYFSKTDSCCRQHDNCNESIAAGQVQHNLKNTGLFSRSNCECDQTFYECLKNANTIISNKIGFTYFSILGPQCFKVDYPIVRCYISKWKRCLAYELNYTQEAVYQWFDNPVWSYHKN